MGLFDFIKTKPKALDKETVSLFDTNIPLRMIKGRIKGYDVKTWTRHYDKNNNILRYGDGVDDKIVRHQEYQELEIYLKTKHFDGYMSPGHHGDLTTIYFERATMFDDFSIGNTITYIGLFIKVGAVWTNYFLYNHNNGTIKRLYFLDTINERIFDKKYTQTKLETELENGIKKINLK